jgi:hypothetical protein
MEETERPEIRFFHLRKKRDFFEFQISLSRSDQKTKYRRRSCTVATSALLSGLSHKEDSTRRMACTIYILLLLTAVRRTEGLLFRSVFKAPLNRNMASQKSMRAFFQTTKSSENPPNKKSRSDEPVASAKRSISHFASAGPSLGGREEDDAEICSCPRSSPKNFPKLISRVLWSLSMRNPPSLAFILRKSKYFLLLISVHSIRSK